MKHSVSQGQASQRFSRGDLELASIPQLLTPLALPPDPMPSICMPPALWGSAGWGWDGKDISESEALGCHEKFRDDTLVFKNKQTKKPAPGKTDEICSPGEAAQGIRKPHFLTIVGSPQISSRGSLR